MNNEESAIGRRGALRKMAKAVSLTAVAAPGALVGQELAQPTVSGKRLGRIDSASLIQMARVEFGESSNRERAMQSGHSVIEAVLQSGLDADAAANQLVLVANHLGKDVLVSRSHGRPALVAVKRMLADCERGIRDAVQAHSQGTSTIDDTRTEIALVVRDFLSGVRGLPS